MSLDKYKINKEHNLLIRYLSLFTLILFFQNQIFFNSMIHIYNIISKFILSFFIEINLINNLLILSNNYTYIINQYCISPNSYLLICLVFLTIPLKLKSLFKIILKSILIFSIFNLIRIIFLMLVHLKLGQEIFNKYHNFFFQSLTAIAITIIVIYYLKTTNIKNKIPLYTDIKYLINEIIKNKK